MKRVSLVILTALLCFSCDPTSVMDANIENTTTQHLSITFVSAEFTDLNKTFEMESKETILCQEGFSTTGGFLEVSLDGVDSVYITNTSNEILKVYKPETTGRNIFEIGDYWESSTPSKRFYQYDYQITNTDIEQ